MIPVSWMIKLALIVAYEDFENYESSSLKPQVKIS